MQVYSFFPVYWNVVDRYWEGEEREHILITLMREYTTVEVEGIVRCLIWRTSSGKGATVLEVALYEEVAEYVKEHEEEREGHLDDGEDEPSFSTHCLRRMTT